LTIGGVRTWATMCWKSISKATNVYCGRGAAVFAANAPLSHFGHGQKFGGYSGEQVMANSRPTAFFETGPRERHAQSFQCELRRDSKDLDSRAFADLKWSHISRSLLLARTRRVRSGQG